MDVTPNNKDNWDFWLIALMLITALVSCFKHYDDEEVAKLTKGGRLRRTIVGGFGSSLIVFLAYEIMVGQLGFYPRVSLAIAGVIGFIGADEIIKLMEKHLDRYLTKKLDTADVNPPRPRDREECNHPDHKDN